MTDNKFDSRKNNVTLASDLTVIKKFTSKTAFENERRCLEILNGVCAPKLIAVDEEHNTVKTEFVKGELLLEYYMRTTVDEVTEIARLVAQTILYIYKTCNSNITFDENFRNYIIRDANVIRLDFEETVSGELLEWVSKLGAFALMYDVTVAKKTTFVFTVFKELQLDKNRFIAALYDETEFLANRWKALFPKEAYDKLVTLLI